MGYHVFVGRFDGQDSPQPCLGTTSGNFLCSPHDGLGRIVLEKSLSPSFLARESPDIRLGTGHAG